MALFAARFASSSAMASGRRSGPSCIWHCTSEWVGRPAPRRGFSTASRSNRPKKEVAQPGGLRRLQVGKGPQDPRPGRQRGAADAGRCPLCRDSGPRRGRFGSRQDTPWLDLISAGDGYNAWQVDAVVAKAPLLRIEIVKRNDDTKGLVCNMSGTRYPGRTAAVGSVKGPSPERGATTGLRRFRPFAERNLVGSGRPSNVIQNPKVTATMCCVGGAQASTQK